MWSVIISLHTDEEESKVDFQSAIASNVTDSNVFGHFDQHSRGSFNCITLTLIGWIPETRELHQSLSVAGLFISLTCVGSVSYKVVFGSSKTDFSSLTLPFLCEKVEILTFSTIIYNMAALEEKPASGEWIIFNLYSRTSWTRLSNFV